MPAVVALLKGVNVGGNNKIGMQDLRLALQNAGLNRVRTYLQSGNIVFDTAGRSPARLSVLLSRVIFETFGITPAIILRSAVELKDLLRRVPFKDANPSRLLITFLTGVPDAGGVRALCALAGQEQIEASETEIFVLYGDDMARSKLLQLPCAKLLKMEGTARNLNTLQGLVKLCDEVEAVG